MRFDVTKNVKMIFNKELSMLIKTFAKSLAVILLTFAMGASAAPVLQIENGILIGAKNIDVDGKKYDVIFTDGFCGDLFSGCAGPGAPLTTYNSSLAAYHARLDQALLDQVFVDGPLGLFDSHPELTRGCSLTTECSALTPDSIFSGTALNFSLAANRSAIENSLPGDYVGMTPFPNSYDFATIPSYTFAVFSEVVNATVPEPVSLWIFALGLAALAGCSLRTRRRRM